MEAEQRAALEPVDVEAFLSADLASETLPVSPPPVSESLGGSLPTAMVERNGGVRLNRVADQHDLHLLGVGGRHGRPPWTRRTRSLGP